MNRGARRRLLRGLGSAAVLVVALPPRTAQSSPQPDPTWNDPGALELVRRGIEARRDAGRIADLSFSARADGYIYFYMDREDGGAPVPLRVDQFSLDLYRGDDASVRQVVRAYRQEELLPIQDFEYYPDRLSVIHNGYGDEIRVGDGRDVRGVPHPLRTDAPQLYDYRFGDAISLSLEGRDEPLRVREIEVRPKDASAPMFIGTVFLDESTGDLVRMSFTVTAAAYVDRRNDRVRVMLEHGLWENRYWLPYQQTIEVRREIPELDLPVGSVIRGELKVSDYTFDSPVESDVFLGSQELIRTPPPGSDTVFRFDGGLYDGMAEQGLTPADPVDIRAFARQVVHDQATSGLPTFRPYLPGASAFFHATRSEGAYVGLGGSFTPNDRFATRVHGGYGIGSERTSVTLEIVGGALIESGWSFGAAAFLDERRDLGQQSGASGLTNTFATLFGGNDYRDVYFADGARAWATTDFGERGRLRIEVSGERHDPSELEWADSPISGGALRGVRTVPDGDRYAAEFEVGITAGTRAGFDRWGELRVEAGSWESEGFGTVRGTGHVGWKSADLKDHATLTLEAGTSLGETPAQHLFLIGGRHTVPGFDYRSFAGTRYAQVRIEGTREVWPRKVAIRGFASAGITGGGDSSLVADDWPVRFSAGPRGSIGGGVALLREILRLDYAFGIGGGSKSEFIFSFNPAFWDFL